MSTNPLDAIIEAAEAREAEEARIKKEKEAADAKIREERRRQSEADKARQQLVNFGRSFIQAVARRVVKTEWKAEYVRLIKAYTETLLNKQATELPTIDAHHADAILDRFAYGLGLYNVPDGTFYGQQLLAEREAAKPAKPERIHIGAKRVVQSDEPPLEAPIDLDAARERLGTTVDLKGPAVTPRSKKPRGSHRNKRTASAG
jgi:hypothetical protein